MSKKTFDWVCPNCWNIDSWRADYKKLSAAENSTTTMHCNNCGAKVARCYDGNRWTYVFAEQPAASAPARGPLHDEIAAECSAICDMLQRKNAAYGNSALEPIRVFSQASPVEQLLVRADDKLARIRNQAADEDAVSDLIGYLILLKIAQRGNQ